MKSALVPLVRGVTYRRGAYLLLGGVVVLPYVLIGVGLVRVALDGRTPAGVVVALVVPAAVIALAPPLLPGTRAVQIAAARALLGVELPDPPGPADRESRLRAALWYCVHLVVGGLIAAVLFAALPAAVVLVTASAGWPAAWSVLFGVALVVGTVYGIAGLGALAAVMAPVLLGPSGAERIAALEAETRRLAEHNRLVRDLHDSVGHALTVTVLQAGAAGTLLDRDPAFVRRALLTIEDTGRAAMDDLDRVLGILRDHEGPTLVDVPGLAAGLPVTLDTSGRMHDVPTAVSREAYRLVQEALTNALKHDPDGPVGMRVAVTAGWVVLEVGNAMHGPGRRGGSRGLAGMRERVILLGGTLEAGPRQGRWRVRAEVPW